MTHFCSKEFLRTHLIWPLLIFSVVLLGFEIANWDVQLEYLFYNAQTTQFLIGKHGWAEHLFHDGARDIVHIYGAICIWLFLATWVIKYVKPYVGDFLSTCLMKYIQPYRRDFLFLVLTSLAAVIVSLLKGITNIHCPSELILFGGQLPYIKIFQPHTWGNSGECWPGGHASAGFSFLGLYFVALRHESKWSTSLLWAGVGLGFFYGSVRMAQGLHFMSHTLWAGAIAWVVMCCLAMLIYRTNP